MIIGWIVQVLIIVLAVIFGVRRALSRGSTGESRSRQIRRFFQYLFLLTLAFITASGFTGLLGKVFDFHREMFNDQATLASNLAFIIVGAPLLFVIARWTRRTLLAEEGESKSYAFKLYLIGAASVSLVMTTVAEAGLLRWIIAGGHYSGNNLSQFLVWLTVLLLHLRLWERYGGVKELFVGYLIGSFVGLTTSLVGLGMVIGEFLNIVFRFQLNLGTRVSWNPVLEGTTFLIVGIPVWNFFWRRRAFSSERNPLWLAYVILVGSGGGFAAAITSLSIGVYNVLVWFIGDTNGESAKVFFQQSPAAIAGFVTGLLVWQYHRMVLSIHHEEGRSEVRRIYDYLLSGIGLVVSTAGTTVIIVSIIESIAKSTAINGDSPVNRLVAAITMVVVGGSVWLTRWIDIQREVDSNQTDELASPTRRIYLFLLFGIIGIVGVVVLIVATSLTLQDLFQGNFGRTTAERVKYPLSILLSSVGVSFYHWGIYKNDRHQLPAKRTRQLEIQLVGPADAEIAHLLSEKSGARVTLQERLDDAGGEWDIDKLVQLVSESESSRLLILCEKDGLKVVPISSK